jgi:glycosyltransferase involved in cell wall biosynthesis
LKIPLSVIILTYQSDRTLGRVLEAVGWTDDLVVVDSGSTDRTLEIARTHGARIFDRKLDGFGRQKRFAVEQARNDWVIVIDSDEVATPELQAELRALFASGRPETTFAGYRLPSRQKFLGRVMRFGGGGIKYPLRLFDRRRGNFNDALVHEVVVLDGPVGMLRHSIWHYSYLSLDDYFVKFNRYTSLAAQELAEQGKKPDFWLLAMSFPAHFIQRYVLKGGFLDGYPGFVWSLFSALYPTVKYAKLGELLRKRQ